MLILMWQTANFRGKSLLKATKTTVKWGVWVNCFYVVEFLECMCGAKSGVFVWCNDWSVCVVKEFLCGGGVSAWWKIVCVWWKSVCVMKEFLRGGICGVSVWWKYLGGGICGVSVWWNMWSVCVVEYVECLCDGICGVSVWWKYLCRCRINSWIFGSLVVSIVDSFGDIVQTSFALCSR